MEQLSECRRRLHDWGRTNRVTFDAGKEHFVMLHLYKDHGAFFRLLGPTIDPHLRMSTCSDQLLNEIRSKSIAIYAPAPTMANGSS